MERPLFQLQPRLRLCADFVREATALVDVGTDHAYLPIWLLRTGRVASAIACDIRPGPLESAGKNAEKYGVAHRLILRLSDGLKQVREEETGDVVLAGMGGELMADILRRAAWLRNPEKRIILQPMSCVEALRAALREMDFSVCREHAAVEGDKIYSVFYAQAAQSKKEFFSYIDEGEESVFLRMGRLVPGEPGVVEYALRVLRRMESELQGAVHSGKKEAAEKLRETMEQIRGRYVNLTSV